jgi:hypothetical protein
MQSINLRDIGHIAYTVYTDPFVQEYLETQAAKEANEKGESRHTLSKRK